MKLPAIPKAEFLEAGSDEVQAFLSTPEGAMLFPRGFTPAKKLPYRAPPDNKGCHYDEPREEPLGELDDLTNDF